MQNISERLKKKKKICSAFWKATYYKITHRYVTNVQVITIIKYKILLLSGYIYIISCSNIIKSITWNNSFGCLSTLIKEQ
jgi:hypothetical protein